jgi:glycosyltransferase involved in cell wall biosynthesis
MEANSRDCFDDLPVSIKRRPFHWRILTAKEADRVCSYAGLAAIVPQAYQVPDDGIRQFLDCDLWIIVSDRLAFPLLPMRPHLLVIYDYLQRYDQFQTDQQSGELIRRAHAAEAVLVTTEFTARDASQFAGLSPSRIKLVPMLAPEFQGSELSTSPETSLPPYFLWTTNLAKHKNHQNALQALQIYYGRYRGSLACHITGVGTEKLFEPNSEHLKDQISQYNLPEQVTIAGELTNDRYRERLRGAAFLWHPARIDNGTFSVIEAAHCGVPSLSSDYPAMREIDEQFGLNLTWMDPLDPNDMAHQLHQMEASLAAIRNGVPSRARLASQSVDNLAGAYWTVIKDYL